MTGKSGGLAPTLIKPMDYCYIVNDKKMKGSGLVRGETVLVTGTKVVPATGKDPYLQRIFVVAIKIEEGILLLPREDNDYQAYMIDPRNLSKVDKETQQYLTLQMLNQYRKK
jgi:hypothetical protein